MVARIIKGNRKLSHRKMIFLTWSECIENDEESNLYAQDLLISLQNDKRITQLEAYRSIAEYE